MERDSGDGVGFGRSIVLVPFLLMKKGEERVQEVRRSPMSLRYKQVPLNPSVQKYISKPSTPSPSKKAHYHFRAGIYPRITLSAMSRRHVIYNPFLLVEKGGLYR